MKFNKSWFTLIELMISITILMILVVMSFVPYSYYNNISKVKLASKDISQSISEARNLAINWLDKSWVNQSIAIYFDLNDKNKIKYYSFNYNSWITSLAFNNSSFLKEKVLPEWVEITSLSWNTDKVIYFNSIYWSWVILEKSNLSTLNSDSLNIKVSYKWSLNPKLNKNIIYYKKTNSIDY